MRLRHYLHHIEPGMIASLVSRYWEQLPLALLLVVLLGLMLGLFLPLFSRRSVAGKRQSVPSLAWLATALCGLPIPILTLWPSGHRAINDGCTLQVSVPTLHSVEPLANIALFVLPAYFATLATRRPVAVLFLGFALSGAIEYFQLTVPAIGRECDANDWAMNTAGTLIGLVLATLVSKLFAPSPKPLRV